MLSQLVMSIICCPQFMTSAQLHGDSSEGKSRVEFCFTSVTGWIRMWTGLAGRTDGVIVHIEFPSSFNSRSPFWELKVEGLRFRSPLVVYRTRLASESHTTCNYSKQHGRLEDVTKRWLPGSYAGHGPRDFEGLKSAMLRICEHVRLNFDS